MATPTAGAALSDFLYLVAPRPGGGRLEEAQRKEPEERGEERRGEQNREEQSKADQSKAEQSRGEERREDQHQIYYLRTEQHRRPLLAGRKD